MSQPPTESDEATTLAEDAEDLFEHAPCGHASTSLDGTIVRVNATLLGWLGVPAAEVVGRRRFASLLTRGGQIFWETHLAPLLRLHGAADEVALELVGPAGAARPVLATFRARTDAAGRPLAYRVSLLDATDRRVYERELVRARERAERASLAKADFLSMMSHEIRTPLNAIVSVAHLLERSDVSPQQERYVRILRSSSEGLLTLINDVLDFSKIEAGKVALSARPFDLEALVHDLLFAFTVQAEDKGLTLRADVADDVPPVVVGDPAKLGQVLRNLVGNAVKFTERGGVTVEVRARARTSADATLAFAVRDTGIGIPAERLDTIFDEFAQADADIAARYGGTGLGLTICRRLLEMHHATITVESLPGHGSTFAFDVTLPIGDRLPEADAPAHDVRGLRALVADDNEVNVYLLSSFLRRWGMEVEVAADGRQAVERVLERDFDVVLMDLQMPVLSGADAARTIRRLPAARFRDLPIIAVTASTRPGEDPSADAAAFTDLIGKPFGPDELLAKIARHVRRAAPAAAVAASTAPALARVLVVDDNEDAATLLAEALRLAGHDSRAALDEAGAIAAAAELLPDVALVDLHLGAESGLDVGPRIRAAAADAGRVVSLIALTGSDGAAARAEARAVGFEAHLVKPVTVQRVLDAVRSVLAARTPDADPGRRVTPRPEG